MPEVFRDELGNIYIRWTSNTTNATWEAPAQPVIKSGLWFSEDAIDVNDLTPVEFWDLYGPESDG